MEEYSEDSRKTVAAMLAEAKREGERLREIAAKPQETATTEAPAVRRDPVLAALVANVEETLDEVAPTYEELMATAWRGAAVVSPNTLTDDEFESYSDDDLSLAADAAKVAIETMRSTAKAYAESKKACSETIDDIVHRARTLAPASSDADAQPKKIAPHAAQQAKDLLARMRREAQEYALAKQRERQQSS